MKKLISLILVAAFIFCCVGCTPEEPQETDPSGTQPAETDSTGIDQTDSSEDPTDSAEPEVLNYTWEQVPYYWGDRTSTVAFASIIDSPETLQNSDYQHLKADEKYNADFFATKTLIISSFLHVPPVGHVVSDFVQNEDGTYLLKIERLTYGFEQNYEFGTSVIIEVDALIDPNVQIIVEITETIVPEDERPHEEVYNPPFVGQA